ncbi:MAG: RNA pseudouridine synthase [Acetatifactor sp.]|nr:RNA pseudouridine synthase [Acetatifactor sp.]
MRTKIVYEDQDILVCHKPAGLATQSAGVTQPDVVSELKSYLKGAYVGMIHRLDQPVEGLLVFARNKKAAAALTRQLEDGTLRKQYCVLVCGHPMQEKGELVDYLSKEGSLSRVVSEGSPGAKKAVLQYQVSQSGRGETDWPQECTCLDICIGTGRFHQIRCQLSHAGMPVLGDRKYGTAESLEMSRRMGIRNTALCAYRLMLKHPASGREISCEICPDWVKQG